MYAMLIVVSLSGAFAAAAARPKTKLRASQYNTVNLFFRPEPRLRRLSGIRPAQAVLNRPSQNCGERFLLIGGRTAQVFNRLSSLLNEPAGFIDQFRRDLLAPQKDFDGQGLCGTVPAPVTLIPIWLQASFGSTLNWTAALAIAKSPATRSSLR